MLFTQAMILVRSICYVREPSYLCELCCSRAVWTYHHHRTQIAMMLPRKVGYDTRGTHRCPVLHIRNVQFPEVVIGQLAKRGAARVSPAPVGELIPVQRARHVGARAICPVDGAHVLASLVVGEPGPPRESAASCCVLEEVQVREDVHGCLRCATGQLDIGDKVPVDARYSASSTCDDHDCACE